MTKPEDQVFEQGDAHIETAGHRPSDELFRRPPEGADEKTTMLSPVDEATTVLPNSTDGFAADQDHRYAEEEQLRQDALMREEAVRREEEARARAEERAARDRALGTIPRTADADLGPENSTIPVRTTDKWAGSLGLFLLRLVTAVVLGVRGFQTLTAIPAMTDFVTQIGLPYPQYFAWGIGAAELLAAIALVFGFATRVAGVGIAGLTVSALALVKWGAFNPFTDMGFSGELELVLAGVGLMLLLVGPGGWSIDSNWRSNRLRAKAGY